jgi:hypothetical protein
MTLDAARAAPGHGTPNISSNVDYVRSPGADSGGSPVPERLPLRIAEELAFCPKQDWIARDGSCQATNTATKERGSRITVLESGGRGP